MENQEYLNYINKVKNINDIKSENIYNLLLILGQSYFFINRSLNIVNIYSNIFTDSYKIKDDETEKNILLCIQYFNNLKNLFKYNFSNYKQFIQIIMIDIKNIDILFLLSKDQYMALNETEKKKITSDMAKQLTDELLYFHKTKRPRLPHIFNIKIENKQLLFTFSNNFLTDKNDYKMIKINIPLKTIENQEMNNPIPLIKNNDNHPDKLSMEYYVMVETILSLNSFLIGSDMRDKKKNNDHICEIDLSFNPLYYCFQKYLERLNVNESYTIKI